MPIDFPANPTNGMVYGNYIYDSSITAWRNVNTDAGIGTLNAMGLKNVVPTSVVVGSGSATINSNGTITLTNVSSVSVNNCFGSVYEKYRINYKLSGNSNALDMLFRSRASGSDYTINYFGGSLYSNYTGSLVSVAAANNLSRGWIGHTHTTPAGLHGQIDYVPTNGVSSYNYSAYSVYLSAIVSGGYECPSATKPDGFTIFSSSQTFSGTINIYGYTN